MTPSIDLRIVRLYEAADYPVDPRDAERGFRVGRAEVYRLGRTKGDAITIETIERGASNGTDITSSHPEVIQTYLALDAGTKWRQHYRLASLLYADRRRRRRGRR